MSQPPNSQEAELSLLSSLINDSAMYHVISGIVTDEHFYTTKHQHIFRAIAGLIKDDLPVDVTLLNNRLNGLVDAAELVGIANRMPTGANAEYYAHIVSDRHARRKIGQLLYRAMQEVNDSNNPTGEVVANVLKGLDYSLPQKRVNSDLYPAIIDTLERLIDLPRGGVKNYVPTGFAQIDRNMRLAKGTLTLIAGDPGSGKTSYLLTIARYMSRHGHRPLLFTLEMSAEQIRQNIIAQELDLCHRDMVAGYLREKEQKVLTGGLGKFNDLNIGVVDGRWNISQVRYQLITEMRLKGVDCVMLDSMGKIKLPEGMSKASGKVHDIYNQICEELVDIAVEFNLPVVLTHHLNKDSTRRGKNNRPTVYSLREAGDMWTHNVMILYREYLTTGDSAKRNEAEAIICKARDGETGTVEIGFSGPSKRFYEIEKRHEPPEVMAGARQWGN